MLSMMHAIVQHEQQVERTDGKEVILTEEKLQLDSEPEARPPPGGESSQAESSSLESSPPENSLPINQSISMEPPQSTTADQQTQDHVDNDEEEAIAQATASADASYVPPPSVLHATTAQPLLRSVDGPSLLSKYDRSPSVYSARGVPVPLRGKVEVPIYVTAGGSVVEYTVESKQFDIGFGIVAQREEGVAVVVVS